jgi:hypothetical protein
MRSRQTEMFRPVQQMLDRREMPPRFKRRVLASAGMYSAAINQGTFCHEPVDALQRTRAQNGALARVRSAFVIN